MTSTITPLLKDFSERSTAVKDELRTYAACDPTGFRADAIGIVTAGGDEAPRRYLIQLLLKHAQLAEFVADPGDCSMEEAVLIAKSAQELGGPLDTALEAVLNNAVRERNAGHVIVRIIDLFAALGVSKLILRLQTDLISHADPRVRSRAVSELVRAGKGPALVSQVLLQPDAEMQANAVEALWDVTDQNVKPVLLIASKSPHHRVAANALAGLYRRGVVESIPQLLQMARHRDPAHRLSAIWAIGETTDPRFLPFLNRAFKTTEGKERIGIVRSLARIRRQVQLSGANLRLTLQNSELLPDGSRRILIALSAPGPHEASQLSSLTPMQFALWAGGELVTNYSMRCQASPPLLILGFAFPHFASKCDPYAEVVTRTLSACALLKRSGDPWTLERYLIDEASRAAVKEQLGLDTTGRNSALAAHMKKHRGFINDSGFVQEIIDHTGPRERAALDLAAVIKKLVDTTSRLSGPRHLFVFFHPEDEGDAGFERLAAAIRDEPVTMHGFVPESGRDVDALRKLCCLTNGGLLHVVPLDQIESGVMEVYLGLMDRYEIVYRLPESAATQHQICELQVSTPVGSGRLTIS